MNRNRLFVFGCLGAIAAIVVLMGIIYYGSTNSPYRAAQARWAEKGGGNYTLVVSESCFCPLMGEFRITVKSGRVIDAQELPSDSNPSPAPGLPQGIQLSYFDGMTIASMLSQAEAGQADAWTDPWLQQYSVSYDPVYGYVTSYYSDPNGRLDNLMGRYVYDAQYGYYAKDLVITEP